MIDRDTHRIRRVVAQACPADRTGSEARLRNLLRALDWRVPALRDETILCVRRMRLPLPRKKGPPVSVELQPPAELQNSLSDSLANLARDAARPSRGVVPANANAVFFADRAELLACLARDWCAGNTTTLWWWPVLFPGDDFGAVVRRAWLDDARPVPAALARLEAANLAPKFLTKFSPTDRAALWRNIVNTLQLDALDAAWRTSDLAPAAPTAAHAPRELAPWSAWINPPVSLAPDAVRILVAAILLERAPARVRSLSFAREVGTWTESRRRHQALEVSSNETFPLVEERSTKNDPRPRVMAPRRYRSTLKHEPPSPSNPKRIAIPGASNPERIIIPGSSNLESTTFESRAAQASPPRRQRPPAFRTPESPVMPGQLKQERLADLQAAPNESIALPAVAWPDCISTEWGGSLYLVNIAIALEIYGDFTTPARRGLALPLWDFLALLAEQMIGEEFAEDPLCSLFATLSGRRAGDEPPGAQFEPPTGETLAIWLARVCHDVEARAIAALGLDEGCDLRPLVLNHPARIETNSTRLDAHFSLAEHPIVLRIAGLDRDPGWVPAGGRGIYFHYD